jgi:hypothetical protein
MCDKELLVAYVYDDIIDMDRARIERHLRECAACRAEAAALRSVRHDLAAWDAPQPATGFKLVQERKPSWRAWWTPAAGLAAAAVLVLAAASAIANVEVSYGANGFAVRTGWNRATQSVAVSPAPAPAQAQNVIDRASATDRAALTAIERRLAALETSAHASAAGVRQVSAPADAQHGSDTAIMRRVNDLVAQSETRQQQELALRIAQLIRDVDAQRVADLMRIQQGQGRIEAMTTAEAVAHRDLASYILTSSKQQK